MASQLSDTLRLHILNLATIQASEETASKPRIKSVEVVRDARVERECDEIRQNVTEVMARADHIEGLIEKQEAIQRRKSRRERYK